MQALDRAVVNAVRHPITRMWRRIFALPVLRLNGYVAFDLPRTVTAVGAPLLTGVAAVHVYLLATQPDVPMYFVGYVAVLAAGCLVAVAAMASGAGSGWYLGSAVCLGFLGVYLVSRFAGPPGLVALTGRWDVAPGSLAMALAAGFLAVHTTVLSGVNAAFPHRQGWHD